MKKTIYLLRHGHTDLTGTYVGATDCPLSSKGLEQIQTLQNNFDFSIAAKLFCSPLLRCKQTAANLSLSVKPTYEPLLREIDFGDWEGLTFGEVFEKYPNLCKKWLEHPDTFVFPNGEAVEDFRKRVGKVAELLTQCSDEIILVVAHGGVIRNLICEFLGLSYDKFNSFKTDVATYAVIELYSDTAILSGINRSS